MVTCACVCAVVRYVTMLSWVLWRHICAILRQTWLIAVQSLCPCCWSMQFRLPTVLSICSPGHLFTATWRRVTSCALLPSRWLVFLLFVATLGFCPPLLCSHTEQQLPFYDHYRGQPALAGTSNWRILLVQSFSSCMFLLTFMHSFFNGMIWESWHYRKHDVSFLENEFVFIKRGQGQWLMVNFPWLVSVLTYSSLHCLDAIGWVMGQSGLYKIRANSPWSFSL